MRVRFLAFDNIKIISVQCMRSQPCWKLSVLGVFLDSQAASTVEYMLFLNDFNSSFSMYLKGLLNKTDLYSSARR